jgi:hypothetical protein
MRFISILLTYVLFLNSVSFAKSYQGREEFHYIFNDQVITPSLTDLKSEISALKSWDDFSNIIQTLPEKYKKVLNSRLHLIKNQPFKLPEMILTNTGFIVRDQGKDMIINAVSSEIIYEYEKYSYKDKSPEELMRWLEDNIKIKVSKFSNIFISNAYAEPLFLGAVFPYYLVASLRSKLNEQADCQKHFSEMTQTVRGYITQCEAGVPVATLRTQIENKINSEKNISHASFIEQSKESCEEEIPKTFKLLGMTCLNKIEVQSMCHMLRKLDQCINKKSEKINNTSRETIKEAPASSKPERKSSTREAKSQ